MIKGVGFSSDGTPVMILGLSKANMDRLLVDQPIVVSANKLDPRLPKIDVLLVGGDSEGAIIDRLNQFQAKRQES